MSPDTHRITRCAGRFFASPGYLIALTALSIAAHLLSLELVAYTVFAGIILYSCVIANDFLPVVPLFLFSYILPSARNNPGKNAGSIFSGTWFLLLIAAVIVALAVFLIRNRKQFFSGKRKLLGGILALFAAYLLSGIGSAAYPAAISRNLLFAAAQGLCLLLPYWFLSSGVQWQNIRRDYLGWTGLCAGILLLTEVLWSYAGGKVIVDGVIERKMIFTGWGMYNNMGAMLGMMIPLAFCLTSRYRKGWLGMLIGFTFLTGVLMTCSRTSLVAALGIYGLCTLVTLLHSPNRKRVLVGIGCFAVLALVVVAVFYRPLLLLFSGFIAKLLDPSSRHIIFAEGWKQFVQAPLFGSSFFSPGLSNAWDFSTLDSFSAIFPPRWHNTFVQLMACCGIVGVGAYLWHRIQTVRLFIRQRGTARIYIGCSIAVLLACSLLDCHFFNMGPVLFYSVMLAFLEYLPPENHGNL